jgi:hypothetical protein
MLDLFESNLVHHFFLEITEYGFYASLHDQQKDRGSGAHPFAAREQHRLLNLKSLQVDGAVWPLAVAVTAELRKHIQPGAGRRSGPPGRPGCY